MPHKCLSIQWINHPSGRGPVWCPSMSVDLNRRTADLYQWYASLAEASFWVPVFFLYFAAYMPLDAVLSLEALYFLSVVTIEVPSGWLSDRLGRKPTMLVGAVLMAVSHLMLFIGPWVMVGDALGSPLFIFFAVGQSLRRYGTASRCARSVRPRERVCAPRSAGVQATVSWRRRGRFDRWRIGGDRSSDSLCVFLHRRGRDDHRDRPNARAICWR